MAVVFQHLFQHQHQHHIISFVSSSIEGCCFATTIAEDGAMLESSASQLDDVDF